MRSLHSLLTLILVIPGFLAISQGNENQEIVSKRTMFSSTYQTPEGKFQAVISGEPVHYENNGDWLPIDQTILHNGVSYVNTSNVIRSEFPSLFSSSEAIVYAIGNDEITLSLNKSLVYYENSLSEVGTVNDNSQATLQGNTIRYANNFNDITDEYVVLNGQVKNNLILNQMPQELAGLTTGLFGFKEKMTLPAGWSIRSSVEVPGAITPYSLNILNENNDPVLDIPAPIFYDDLGVADDGKIGVQGAFYVEETNEGWYISTLVPVTWLKDAARIYPLTIDPSVTIAGTTGGWQSQNNYVDNPGFVFIGVCCGNLEHRAWLKWNVSSIPDAACVTRTEIQVYVNGVGSSTAELVHFLDMMETTTTGLFGPYGAIMPAVYNDQGNGYYASCTMTGTGYYGYYDLGANANTDVMTMMNSYDWYQVSVIFDNEPSTNWKRMTGGMCNLTVTYDNPPCTILPVEVADIDVKCEDNKAQLNWTTVSEKDNDFFTIWRSLDGEHFAPVAQVKGNGSTQSVNEYQWTSSERVADAAYYQLSQTDYDGNVEFYDVLAFNGCDIDLPVVMVEDLSKIKVEGASIDQVVVSDATGRRIEAIDNSEKRSQLELDPVVEKGFYIVTIYHHQGAMTSQTVYLER